MMRLFGIGREGVSLFTNFMDLGGSICKSRYESFVEYTCSASKTVSDENYKITVKIVRGLLEKLKESINIFKVSGDGTWKKKGHRSLISVTTLIANGCGRVINLVVKSLFCQKCTAHKKSKD